MLRHKVQESRKREVEYSTRRILEIKISVIGKDVGRDNSDREREREKTHGDGERDGNMMVMMRRGYNRRLPQCDVMRE